MTILFLAILTYTIVITYFLSKIGIWNASQLKNTVLWFLTVGVVSLSHINDKSKINYLKETLKDVVSITAALQFLFGIYSFSLVTELILLPVLVLIGCMNAIAKQKEYFQHLAGVLQNLILYGNLFLICYTLFKIVTDFKSFANTGTFTDFLVPALLSILFLPMLYALSIYVTHQDILAAFENKIKNRGLFRYLKWKALIHFHINKTDLYRWQKLLFLKSIKSKKDINKTIALVKEMKRKEKHPVPVEINEGWSPYAALKFLESKGIATGYYQPSYNETEWMACSKYIDVDENIPPSNISYYIEGDARVAKKLTIHLTVFNKKLGGLAIAEFNDIVDLLCKNALKLDISQQILEAVIANKDWEIQIENKKLQLKRNVLNNEGRGYYFTFKIENIY